MRRLLILATPYVRPVAPLLGLVASLAISVLAMLGTTSQSWPWLLPVPALLVYVAAVWKERFEERRIAAHIVQQTVGEFRQLIGASHRGKSIFSHESLAGRQKSLWAKYGKEKAVDIGLLIGSQVEACLQKDPRQAFLLLCTRSTDLGNFITYFREHFEGEGSFNSEMRDWYNNTPINAYHTYVNNLNNAVKQPNRYFDKSVMAEAQDVDACKPPRA